jgi:hypothetical protein
MIAQSDFILSSAPGGSFFARYSIFKYPSDYKSYTMISANLRTLRTSVAVIYQGHIPARYSKLGHRSSSWWGSRVIIGGEILFDFK